MAIFGPKPWVNRFGKISIFCFCELCFYSLERRFFVRQYHKRPFPGLYCLKKKVAKMAIFIPTSWVTPLEKCQFSTVWTLCFYSLERRFLVLEYNKTHFPGLYCQKKKSRKNGHFFDQNHGLTPLEKWQFFDCLNFMLL